MAQAAQHPRVIFWCDGDGEQMRYSNLEAWDAFCRKMILAVKQRGCMAFQGKGMDNEFIVSEDNCHFSQDPENEMKFVEVFSRVSQLMLCLYPKEKYMSYVERGWRKVGPSLEKGER